MVLGSLLVAFSCGYSIPLTFDNSVRSEIKELNSFYNPYFDSIQLLTTRLPLVTFTVMCLHIMGCSREGSKTRIKDGRVSLN